MQISFFDHDFVLEPVIAVVLVYVFIFIGIMAFGLKTPKTRQIIITSHLLLALGSGFLGQYISAITEMAFENRLTPPTSEEWFWKYIILYYISYTLITGLLFTALWCIYNICYPEREKP